MRRFVLDPNVLVTALGGVNPSGPPALLVAAIRARKIEVIICPVLICEVRRTLRKPYFRSRLSEQEARREIAAIERLVSSVNDPANIPTVLRDPTDDYLVALARNAHADAIISGDKDLLEHPNLQPRAITPRDACNLIGLSDAT